MIGRDTNTKEKTGNPYMTFQQKNYVKNIIKRKLTIIYGEVKKDVFDADRKLIRRTFYKRLRKDLSNYYNIKYLNEIKPHQYISVLKYIEYFLYEHENGKMYGWESLHDNKKVIDENLYLFPFAQ